MIELQPWAWYGGGDMSLAGNRRRGGRSLKEELVGASPISLTSNGSSRVTRPRQPRRTSDWWNQCWADENEWEGKVVDSCSSKGITNQFDLKLEGSGGEEGEDNGIIVESTPNASSQVPVSANPVLRSGRTTRLVENWLETNSRFASGSPGSSVQTPKTGVPSGISRKSLRKRMEAQKGKEGTKISSTPETKGPQEQRSHHRNGEKVIEVETPNPVQLEGRTPPKTRKRLATLQLPKEKDGLQEQKKRRSTTQARLQRGKGPKSKPATVKRNRKRQVRTQDDEEIIEVMVDVDPAFYKVESTDPSQSSGEGSSLDEEDPVLMHSISFEASPVPEPDPMFERMLEAYVALSRCNVESCERRQNNHKNEKKMPITFPQVKNREEIGRRRNLSTGNAEAEVKPIAETPKQQRRIPKKTDSNAQSKNKGDSSVIKVLKRTPKQSNDKRKVLDKLRKREQRSKMTPAEKEARNEKEKLRMRLVRSILTPAERSVQRERDKIRKRLERSKKTATTAGKEELAMKMELGLEENRKQEKDKLNKLKIWPKSPRAKRKK